MSEEVQERPMPTYRQVAAKLKELATERGEWAGFPMMVEGLELCLEPRFPYDLRLKPKPAAADDFKIVNSWFSSRLRCEVVVGRDAAGRARFGYRAMNQAAFLIDTMRACDAWLLEAERSAIDKLATMLSHRMFTAYMLVGAFLETSKRSGVTYMFRKLRPTLALRPDGDEGMRILCGLCLHPVGYYAGTWAGAQTPTDDMVAHLLMMRGDEPKFWANANQHHPSNPACGL